MAANTAPLPQYEPHIQPLYAVVQKSPRGSNNNNQVEELNNETRHLTYTDIQPSNNDDNIVASGNPQNDMNQLENRGKEEENVALLTYSASYQSSDGSDYGSQNGTIKRAGAPLQRSGSNIKSAGSVVIQSHL